jgi:hypothetical protein
MKPTIEILIGSRASGQFVHLAAPAPKNFGAHYDVGILAMREGRLEEAERELRAAACRLGFRAVPCGSRLPLFRARRFGLDFNGEHAKAVLS